MFPLPPSDNKGAKCFYCGKTGFRLIQSETIRGKWDLVSESGEFHDTIKCKKEHGYKNDLLPKDKTKIIQFEPMYYYGKHIKDVFEISKFKYAHHPKKQGIIKQICSCTLEDSFPILLKRPNYYFKTDILLDTKYEYWCANCGLDLSTKSIKTYFDNLTLDKSVEIKEEKKVNEE